MPTRSTTLADTKINHATTFRRGVEEGLIDPKRTIQIGLRGSRFSPDDIKWGEDKGFTCVTYDEFEEKGRDWLLKKIDQVTGKGPVYITIDIDGLDPAWAIGTGVPEIGGLTPTRLPGHPALVAGQEPGRRRYLRSRTLLRSLRHHVGHRRQSHVGNALRHRRRAGFAKEVICFPISRLWRGRVRVAQPSNRSFG